MSECNISTPPEERWKPVVGYEDLYLVSTLGRIISVRRGRLMKPQLVESKQYPSQRSLIVLLRKEGISKCFTVPRLVLTAFGSLPQEGWRCRHLDGNSLNNVLTNLAWGFRSRNPVGGASTLDEFKRVIRYDPHTGNFYWVCNRGGSAHSGSIAGAITTDGYIRIRGAGRDYFAHRLAWAFMTGDWPPRSLVVEHYNSNKVDNRWANLFAVTDEKNMQNPNDGPLKNNCSGCRGVSILPSGNWRARIRADGRYIHLGVFVDLEQAIAARKAAECLYLTPGHSEALDLKLRSVLGDNYILRQVPLVRPMGISPIG